MTTRKLRTKEYLSLPKIRCRRGGLGRDVRMTSRGLLCKNCIGHYLGIGFEVTGPVKVTSAPLLQVQAAETRVVTVQESYYKRILRKLKEFFVGIWNWRVKR